MGLREHVQLLLRAWWLIALATALGAGGAALLSARAEPSYRATTRLMVYQAPAVSGVQDYTAILTSDRLVRTFKEVMLARPFLEAATRELGLAVNAADLAQRVEAQMVRDTQVIVISVEDTDAARAAAIANALARTFIAHMEALNRELYAAPKAELEQQLAALQLQLDQINVRLFNLGTDTSASARAERASLQLELGQLNSSHAMIFRSLESVRAAETQASRLLHVVEPAVPPGKPGSHVTLILLGAMVGAALATTAVTLHDYLRPAVRDSGALGRQLGRPVLAEVARLRGCRQPARLVLESRGERVEAEPYALLLARLGYADGTLPRSLLVAGCSVGAGASTTALNLAATAALAGLRVVLVDAKLGQPSLHHLLGCANQHGLSTWLREPQRDLACYLLATELDNLRLLSAGAAAANPAQLLLGAHSTGLAAALGAHADLVILDGPALAAAEAPLLAQLCAATLLVVRHGASAAPLAHPPLWLLAAPVNLVGAVLNGTPQPRWRARRRRTAASAAPPPAPTAQAEAPHRQPAMSEPPRPTQVSYQ